MRIVHLSDPHLTIGPTAAGPALGLELALRRAAALDPPPDCVVVTGDLADAGRRREYADLRHLLDDVALPVHLAIGNHDDRDAFVEAFAGSRYLNGGARCHYAVEYAEATVVVLDSKDDSTAAGHLDPEQLGWLDDQLARRPALPSVICLHHPPVPVGIPALDAIRLATPDELQEVLSRHRPVAQILAGHVHRMISARFAGATVSVAPSTYRQVDLQLRPDTPAAYVHEPVHILLHLLTGDDCVTHAVPVTHTSAGFGTV
jgi:3',5'-cyclic AMP phosphodiesterase CpdA